MGKFVKKIRKERRKLGEMVFEVAVKIHGKNPHMEYYRVPVEDYEKADALGLLNNIGKAYYDWKPLFYINDKATGLMAKVGKEKFKGGLYKVTKYITEGEYTYAYLENDEEPDFLIPEYLFSRMKREGRTDYILVGKRMKDRELKMQM